MISQQRIDELQESYKLEFIDIETTSVTDLQKSEEVIRELLIALEEERKENSLLSASILNLEDSFTEADKRLDLAISWIKASCWTASGAGRLLNLIDIPYKGKSDTSETIRNLRQELEILKKEIKKYKGGKENA